jgi:hypothetical protein
VAYKRVKPTKYYCSIPFKNCTLHRRVYNSDKKYFNVLRLGERGGLAMGPSYSIHLFRK